MSRDFGEVYILSRVKGRKRWYRHIPGVSPALMDPAIDRAERRIAELAAAHPDWEFALEDNKGAAIARSAV